MRSWVLSSGLPILVKHEALLSSLLVKLYIDRLKIFRNVKIMSEFLTAWMHNRRASENSSMT
jgi:hypothetical protein